MTEGKGAKVVFTVFMGDQRTIECSFTTYEAAKLYIINEIAKLGPDILDPKTIQTQQDFDKLLTRYENLDYQIVENDLDPAPQTTFTTNASAVSAVSTVSTVSTVSAAQK